MGNSKRTHSAVIAYTLNLLDLFCTLWALQHGATELNPLMRCFSVLVVYKLVVVGLLTAWLSRRREWIARLGLRLCTAAYTILACYHVICLLLIGGMIW